MDDIYTKDYQEKWNQYGYLTYIMVDGIPCNRYVPSEDGGREVSVTGRRLFDLFEDEEDCHSCRTGEGEDHSGGEMCFSKEAWKQPKFYNGKLLYWEPLRV